MPSKHTVTPGDWLEAVAHAYGLRRGADLWEHPLNQALRSCRRTPDLICVDDELQIPDRAEEADRGIEVQSRQRVVFVAGDPLSVLRLRVTDVGPLIQVLGPVPFKFEAGSACIEGELTEDGQCLELPLNKSVRTAKLTLMDDMTREFSIGGLGPDDEARGAYARITNLAVVPVAGNGAAEDPDPEAEAEPASESDPIEEAIAAFQSWIGLTVTGVLDGSTVAALRRLYEGEET